MKSYSHLSLLLLFIVCLIFPQESFAYSPIEPGDKTEQQVEKPISPSKNKQIYDGKNKEKWKLIWAAWKITFGLFLLSIPFISHIFIGFSFSILNILLLLLVLVGTFFLFRSAYLNMKRYNRVEDLDQLNQSFSDQKLKKQIAVISWTLLSLVLSLGVLIGVAFLFNGFINAFFIGLAITLILSALLIFRLIKLYKKPVNRPKLFNELGIYFMTFSVLLLILAIFLSLVMTAAAIIRALPFDTALAWAIIGGLSIFNYTLILTKRLFKIAER